MVILYNFLAIHGDFIAPSDVAPHHFVNTARICSMNLDIKNTHSVCTRVEGFIGRLCTDLNNIIHRHNYRYERYNLFKTTEINAVFPYFTLQAFSQ